MSPEPSLERPTQPAPATSVAAGRLNLLAVVSLVLGAAYFAVGISFGLAGRTASYAFFVLPASAVIAGYVARGQIWRRRERGRLVAGAGISLGYLGLALFLFGWVLTVVFR